MSVWEMEKEGYMGQRKGNLATIPRQRGENSQVSIDAQELNEGPNM